MIGLRSLKSMVARMFRTPTNTPIRKTQETIVKRNKTVRLAAETLEARDVPAIASGLWNPPVDTGMFSTGPIQYLVRPDGAQAIVNGTAKSGEFDRLDVQLRTGGVVFTDKPFGGTFMGQTRVAAGDINKDGITDLAATAGLGGGCRVVIYLGNANGTYTKVHDFFALGDQEAQIFRGGGQIAIGFGKVTWFAGEGGGPRVITFDGEQLARGVKVVVDNRFVFDPNLRDGANGRWIKNNGQERLVVAPGEGGGPHIRVIDIAPGGGSIDFFGFNPSSRAGANIGGGELYENGPGVVTVTSRNGDNPVVRLFDASTGALLGEAPLRETMPQGAFSTVVPSRGPGEKPVVWVGGQLPLHGPHTQEYAIEGVTVPETLHPTPPAIAPVGHVRGTVLADTDIKPNGPNVTAVYAQVFVDAPAQFSSWVTSTGNTSGIAAWVKITDGDNGPTVAQWDFPTVPAQIDLPAITLQPGHDYRYYVTTSVTGPVTNGQTFQFQLKDVTFGPTFNRDVGTLPFHGPTIVVLNDVVPNVPPVPTVPGVPPTPVSPPPTTVPPSPPVSPPPVPETARVTVTNVTAAGNKEIIEGAAPIVIGDWAVNVADNPTTVRDWKVNVAANTPASLDDVTLWGVFVGNNNTVLGQDDAIAVGGIADFDFADFDVPVGDYHFLLKAGAASGVDGDLEFTANTRAITLQDDGDAIFMQGPAAIPTVEAYAYPRVNVLGFDPATTPAPVTIVPGTPTTISVESIQVTRDVTITGASYTLLSATPGLTYKVYLELGSISVAIGTGTVTGNTLNFTLSNQIFSGVVNNVDLSLKAETTDPTGVGAVDGGTVRAQLIGYTFEDSLTHRAIPGTSITMIAGPGPIATVDL